MTVREYKGARYVPLFMGDWDVNADYEPLSIVQYRGNSYTSRQAVPHGVEITNEAYWAETGNYNAQVEAYRQEVLAYDGRITDNANGIAAINDALPIADYNANATVTDAIRAVEKSANAKFQKVENKLAEKAFSFKTVADMKAAENLFDGAICHTSGFNSIGDGGAAWYTISDTGTANEMDVIACGNLYANYILLNNEVLPEQMGAYGDDTHDDTLACQRALDICPNVMFSKNYLVSKGDVSRFGDSASCLMLNNNQHVYGNGTIHSNVHGQSVLGVHAKTNIVIEDVRLRGYGTFPILDGTTGRGEKGDANGGWQTGGFWYYYFNNSYDTSERTDHTSYGTGVPWGTFGNGGFFGNIGSGLLVTGASENIKITGIESYGFNGAGITIGHYGETGIKKNIKILNCICHDNYSAGIDMYLYEGLLIDGCTIYDIGHPDAEPTDTYQDPGYGTACSISDTAKKTIITNNYIHDCVRKGVDAHGVDTIIVSNNEIDNCWTVGIDLEGNGSTSFIRKAIVQGNRISNCSYSNNKLGAMFLGNTQNTVPIENGNITISDNQIIDCGFANDFGVFSMFIFNRMVFTNNIISGVKAMENPQSSYPVFLFGTSRARSKYLLMENNIFDYSQQPLVKANGTLTNIDYVNASNNMIIFDSTVALTNVQPIGTSGKAPIKCSLNNNLSNSKGSCGAYSQLSIGTSTVISDNGFGTLSVVGEKLHYVDSSGTDHTLAYA